MPPSAYYDVMVLITRKITQRHRCFASSLEDAEQQVLRGTSTLISEVYETAEDVQTFPRKRPARVQTVPKAPQKKRAKSARGRSRARP